MGMRLGVPLETNAASLLAAATASQQVGGCLARLDFMLRRLAKLADDSKGSRFQDWIRKREFISSLQYQRRAQANVARGCANLDFEFARIGHPPLFVKTPVGERGAIQSELHCLRFAGFQLDALKSLKLVHGPVDLCVAIMHIKL